jgi:hypothetical protein
MAYDNRNFVIFDVSELDKIDFSSVLETSAETVRKSVDKSKTFVKWDGDVPACVESLTTKGEYLTYQQIMEILNGPEWSNPFEEDM